MEKKNLQYLQALRKAMSDAGIYAVVVSGTDPHQSENPPAHWRGREWLTGFMSENGTNGTAVVTPNEALCWTDSRYFIQATDQLQGTGFEMMAEDGPDAVDLVEWLTEHVPAGKTVAIDGMTFSVNAAKRMQQQLADKGVKFNDNFPLFDYIWPERPARPANKLFIHDEGIVGEEAGSRMNRVMQQAAGEQADAILLSALDDIAWTTNLRTAGDINYSPIYVAFLYLDEQGRRILFIDDEKLTPEVKAHLQKYNVETRPYSSVADFVSKLPASTRLLIDPDKTARSIFDRISCTPVFGGASVAKLKSIKTDQMLSSLHQAMIKDGVALTAFFMEVEEQYPGGKLTEIGLARRLRQLRLSDPTCVDESFASIIGWNGHGAIVHYEPTEESSVAIEGSGLLLVDSGGQYTQGTTDITRTVALGTPTAEQKHDFTLVIKGNIALASAKFPKGTRGSQLDVLARQYLWNEGKAYYHGTGHGVGFFINCHEGPQNIRLNENPATLEPGMVTSDEPGLYLEGRYGIRSENLIATVPWKTTEFGDFYRFEVMTLFPFDRNLFETEIMTETEIEWINTYHAKVYDTLAPYLNDAQKAWMRAKTLPITRNA